MSLSTAPKLTTLLPGSKPQIRVRAKGAPAPAPATSSLSTRSRPSPSSGYLQPRRRQCDGATRLRAPGTPYQRNKAPIGSRARSLRVVADATEEGPGPIVVVGARGKTGRKVVSLAAKSGMTVRAGTYSSGSLDMSVFGLSPEQQSAVTAVQCDVKSKQSLAGAVAGAAAVVYAASASATGGSAGEVDRDGVIATAEACIAAGVPRLVIVSSGSVSKPTSPVYLFLNLFGGIMEAKIDGEDAVRALYKGAQLGGNQGVAYTVVRPGGLTEDAPVGVAKVAINQGDDISGRISRWDVADICLNSITAPDAANATFECYNFDSAQDLANVGFSNIMGSTVGARRAGPREKAEKASFDQLFVGLRPDDGPQKGAGFFDFVPPSLP